MKKNYFAPQTEDLTMISADLMQDSFGIISGSGNEFSEEDEIL